MELGSNDIDFGKRFTDFMAALSEGQFKPQARAQRDLVSGILKTGTTVVAESARVLKEPRRLIHTEKRLTENLASERWNDASFDDNYLKRVLPYLKSSKKRPLVVALDETDIAKPHARRLPFIGPVRDGSERGRFNKETRRHEVVLKNGYLMLSVEATDAEGRMPLCAELFSYREPEFAERRDLMWILSRRIIVRFQQLLPKEAIWAMDRGFDANDWIWTLQKLGVNFVIRMNYFRRNKIVHRGKRMELDDLLESIPTDHRHTVRRYKNGKTRLWKIRVGWINDVRLPAKSGRQSKGDAMTIVRCTNNIGGRHIVLITNKRVRTADEARAIVDAYHDRWASEEAFRFMKSRLGLERMQTQRWNSLRRLAKLASVAYGYLAFLVRSARKQVERMCLNAQAFGRVPRYLFYRMMTGIDLFVDTPRAVDS